MSKLVFPLVGIGGVSVIAVGSYMAFGKDSKPTTTQIEETFRQKYSEAILSKGDSLWDAKLTSLKNGGSPTHKKLIDAKAKTSPQSNEQQAKQLLIEGCSEIYDSKLKGSLYEEDFKSYCSKTIKDGITGTWITESHAGNGTHWNPKLTNLNSHNENENGVLDDALKSLRDQLTGNAGNTWDDTKRKSLKDWCDASQKEIFMGESDSRFKHSKLYCLENT